MSKIDMIQITHIMTENGSIQPWKEYKREVPNMKSLETLRGAEKFRNNCDRVWFTFESNSIKVVEQKPKLTKPDKKYKRPVFNNVTDLIRITKNYG